MHIMIHKCIFRTESGQVDGINGNVDLNISIHGGKDENE